MQAIDDEIETIHLYVVPEKVKQTPFYLPLFAALLSLASIIGVTIYSAYHPVYEHETLTVAAHFLPLKVFRAEAQIVPTGIKTYPATYAHGFLTFSNGSVIGQSVPVGFTIDGAMTDRAIYVPPATANGFGVSTVPAHLLISGINLLTLSINEVIGSSLFIRNLSPFTGGHPAYSVKFVTAQDKEVAYIAARNLLLAQVSGYHYPCQETKLTSIYRNMYISWRCQFLTFTVPKYMHISAVKLVGRNFLVDVSFISPVRIVWVRR